MGSAVSYYLGDWPLLTRLKTKLDEIFIMSQQGAALQGYNNELIKCKKNPVLRFCN